MYKIYLKTQLRTLYRSIQEIGYPRFAILVLILSLGTVFLYFNASGFIIPALFMAIISMYHSSRNDKKFLRQYYAKTHLLYWIEYSLIASPFILLSLIKLNFIELVSYPVIIIAVPFLFNIKAKKIRLSFPFLRKGSYEFQTGFRSKYPLFIILYILAFLGVYNDNYRILYFCTLVASFFLGLMQNIDEKEKYIATYNSVNYMIGDKAKNTIRNTSLLLFPIIILSVFSEIEITITIYIATIISTFGAKMIRLIFLNNSIVSVIFFTFGLFPLVLISALYTYTLLILLGIVVLISLHAKAKCNKFYNYGNNK